MADPMDSFFNSEAPGVSQAGEGGQQSSSPQGIAAPEIPQQQAAPSQPSQASPASMDEFFTDAPKPLPGKTVQPSAPQSMDDFFNGKAQQAPLPSESDSIPLGEPDTPQQMQPAQGTRPGYLEAFNSAVQRGVGQFEEAIPAFQGIYAEAQGDEEGKQEAIKQIREIEARQPKPQVGSLSDIHNLDDFYMWSVEKLGEQTPVLASMLVSGGAGALVGNLAGRGLLLRAASQRALTNWGAKAGVFAGSVGVETPSTATEQVQATGNFNPALSVGAGLVKGALESYTPFKFLEELPTLGIVQGALRSTGREAITEGLQEQVDILARKYSDPNYKYFSSDMVLRTAESMAAGGLVGGVAAAGGHALGSAAGLKHGDQGEDTPVDPNDSRFNPPTEPSEVQTSGPLSWLRNQFMRGNQGSPETVPEAPTAPDDVVEQGVITQGVRRAWKKSRLNERQLLDAQNLYDDNTPRYAILDSGGNAGTQLYNSTELEEALALRANEQFQPRIVKVDMKSLQPGAITADLFDLPDSAANSRVFFPNKKRMFFLPGTSQAEQDELTFQFDQLIDQVQAKPWQVLNRTEEIQQQMQSLQDQYQSLLDKGLRVIPSAGSGFRYNGVVDGEQQRGVPKSGRTVQVAYMNPDGSFSNFSSQGEATASNFGNNLVVALDLNKVPKDALVWSSTGKPVDWEALPNFDEDIGTFKVKEGVKLPKNAIVSGVDLPELANRKDQYSRFFTPENIEDSPNLEAHTLGRVTNELVESDPTELKQAAKELEAAVKALQPTLRSIYKRLGIRNPPDVRIGREVTSYDTAPNIINLRAAEFLGDNWKWHGASSDKQFSVLFDILHELGHGVTTRSWASLPSAVHEQAQIAYQRDLLKYRIQGRTEHLGFPLGSFTSTDRQVNYNLTFPEWQAESFRRWALSDAQVLTALEDYFKDGGDWIRKLRREAAEALGEDRAKDLYQANFGFNQVMEYLEAANEGGLRPIQMMAKALSLDESYPTPLELAAVRQQVEAELARFRNLLTADMQVELVSGANVTDRNGSDWTKFGTMTPDTRMLRIFIGSLALAGEKTDISETVAHEIFHGVQDALSDAEMQLLVEAGRRLKIIAPADLRNIVKDAKEWLDDNGIVNEEERQKVVRYSVDNEYGAAMIQSRANGLQVESIIAKILDRIIETVQRITNYVRGLGYQSAEDVIRAFYKGEFTKRYDDVMGVEQHARELEAARGFAAASPTQSSGVTLSRPLMNPDQLQLDADNFVTLVESRDAEGKVRTGTYLLKSATGVEKGFVEFSYEAGTGYVVDMVNVQRPFFREGVPMKLYKLIEERMGETPKSNGLLTQAGYRALRRINPMLVSNYVWVPEEQLWFEPTQLDKHIKSLKAVLARDKRLGRDTAETSARIQRWAALQKSISVDKDEQAKAVWRELRLREEEAEQARNENELVESITGERLGATQDPFEQIADQRAQEETQKAAKLLNVDPSMAAPSQAELQILRAVMDNFKKGEKNPQVNRYLSGLSAEADRISWFSKLFFGLHQLIWRNEHLYQTRQYLALVEQMNSRIMGWISRADDTAKGWDRLPEAQRNLLT